MRTPDSRTRDTITQQYTDRREGILQAWKLWLHAIVKAMGETPDDPDWLVTDELALLMDELDQCRAVGDLLMPPGDPDDDEAPGVGDLDELDDDKPQQQQH